MSESYALYFVADGHLLPKVYSVMACTKPRLPALIEFEKAVKALIAVATAVAATTPPPILFQLATGIPKTVADSTAAAAAPTWNSMTAARIAA